MPAQVKVDTCEMERAMRSLSERARRQVKFAAAVALTRTAKAAEQDLRTDLRSGFDKPTPFIARGTFSTSAKKTSLQAWVGMRDQSHRPRANPALYVREHFGGGQRGAKPFERALQSMGLLPRTMRAVPAGGLKTDRYGNPDRKVLAELFGSLRTRMSAYKGRGRRASTIGYFAVVPGQIDRRTAHLSPGIWRRAQNTAGDRAVQPVLAFVDAASYRAALNMEKTTTPAVRDQFPRYFRAAFADAMRTAR